MGNEQQGPAVDPSSANVLRRNSLLLAGGALWWCSHFLLLWNPQVAIADSMVSGHDSRFDATVATTVLALLAIALLTRGKRRRRLCNRTWPYVAFAIGMPVSFGLIASATFPGVSPLVGLTGSILSGLTNSIMLVILGELHARPGHNFVPLFLSVENLAGIGCFFVASLLPLPWEMGIAALLTILTAMLFFFYSRSASEPEATPEKRTEHESGISARQFGLLAFLFGFTYGFMRIVAFGEFGENSVARGMLAESIGTILCALLLLAMYLLQKKWSLFEQCLLVVAPLVATGMLLVSVLGPDAIAPAIINTAGFACFFNLTWYFAAMQSDRQQGAPTATIIAALFCASQFGQLLGALIPRAYSNAVSDALVYLLLILAIASMYWQAKTNTASTGDTHGSAHNAEVLAPELAASHGLSVREEQVVSLLALRTPYRQIAQQLGVSENTVKTHVRNIYKKVGVTSREELLEALKSYESVEKQAHRDLDSLTKKG